MSTTDQFPGIVPYEVASAYIVYNPHLLTGDDLAFYLEKHPDSEELRAAAETVAADNLVADEAVAHTVRIVPVPGERQSYKLEGPGQGRVFLKPEWVE